MKAILSLVFATLVLITGSAAAQKQNQDWASVITGDEFYSAFTVNDSAHLFGQWCYFPSGNCMYLIGIDTACNDDATYSVLANSDAGAQMLELKCMGSFDMAGAKRYRYAFTDFEVIDTLVRKANRVGFAMALKDGYFNVVRFTLASSNLHLDRMRTAAKDRLTTKPPRAINTKDLKL